jgi:type II secretory pathway component PulF
MPGLGWYTQRLDGAAVLDALTLTVESAQPMAEGLQSLSRSFPVLSVRRRLRLAARAVEGGQEWVDTLCRRGLLGRADAAVLRAAQQRGSLAAAMRSTAARVRSRASYRTYAALQVLGPALLLIIAAGATLFSVGMMYPLVTLIESLVG